MATNLVTVAIDDLFAYDQFRDSFGVTIHTPNLDRLMDQSVNFENAYASVAICAPSRAATMSGKTAFETGVHDNFTPLFDVVDSSETWPAMIRDNGYFATGSGKVFHSKGGTTGVQQAYSEPIVSTKSTLTGERVFTDGGKKWAYLGDDADLNDHDVATFGIDFLDRAPSDQPFLLTLGFDHPHTAYFAPQRYFEMYPVDQIQIPTEWFQGDLSDVPAFAQQFVSQPRGGEPFADLDEWKATVQGYLASITHMDAQLGRFLDALEASEHADDTAIMVYSDHGYQLGAKDHPVKFTLWEESAKAPLMLYHPDLEGGKTVTTPVSLMDIMPTVLDITGTAIPDGLVGQSLLSFVTGDGEGYEAKPALTSMYGSFAIRSGDFRYIRYQDGSEELYNVVTDPGQIDNLVNDPAAADVLTQLRGELLESAREAGALIDPDVAVLLGTDGADQGVASPTNQVIALGDGNDAYFVFGNTTDIVETATGGYDTVYYMGSDPYRMQDNVERVYLTLPDNTLGEVTVFGNDGNNDLYTGYIRGVLYGEGGNDGLYGGGWVAHDFYGGAGNDTLIGAKFADLLVGGEGNDTIQGWNKSDSIFGGEGNDFVDAGNDADYVEGGLGHDILLGEHGADVLLGGVGRDVLSGGGGDDRLHGGDDADTLFSGSGSDILDGGGADDVFWITEGRDFITGGTGFDTYRIGATAGHRVIDETASQEADQIVLESTAVADVTVYRIGDALHLWTDADRSVWIDGALNNGDDSVVFVDGTESLDALAARAVVLDVPLAGYGNDTVTGTSLGDQFVGHVGQDSFSGKSGADVAYGGAQADYLNGGNDNDQLFGGDGSDELQGGNGNDTLDGGAGDDLLVGGGGADVYVYRLGDGNDVIEDKGFAAGDVLNILGTDVGSVSQSEDGWDLVLEFADGANLRIVSHLLDKGRIEQIEIEGIALPGPVIEPDPAPGPEPVEGGNLQGTDADDRLNGTAADEELVDGAGKDNLFGGDGADTFILVADGDADSIKDFQNGQDQVDVSAWGVSGMDGLRITQGGGGKVAVKAGTEVLSLTNVTRDLDVNDIDAADFIFAEGPGYIEGTDGNDRLYGTELDETLLDGAGKDNVYGRSGADTFAFVADGVADAIRDFEIGTDMIDLSAWAATDFADLTITDNGAGKVAVRSGGEVLSVTDANRSLSQGDLTADAFMF